MTNARIPSSAFLLEKMEPRVLLAGDVTAVLRGTNLQVSDDAQNNSIIVEQTDTGFVITGVDGTTVNGQAAVTLNGTPRNVTFNMSKGGDNTVEIRGEFDITGKVSYRGGSGVDTFIATALDDAANASGTIVFNNIAAQAATGDINFVVSTPAEAAEGSIEFIPDQGEAATSTITISSTGAEAAVGTVTVTQAAATAATGGITLTNQVDPGDEVTINDGNGAETFTFVVGAPANPNEVQIGADANASAAALAAAIAAHANLAVDAGAANNIVLVTANDAGNIPNWEVSETTDPNGNLTVVDSNGEDTANAKVGETVTVDDGTNAPVVFTFVAGAPATPEEVQVGATADDTATNLAARINAHAGLAVAAAANANVVTITSDTVDANADFEVTETGDNLAAAFDTGLAAGNARAGDTIVVDDGINAPLTFTFVVGAPANNLEVQIGATPGDTAANLAQQINDQPDLDVTATADGAVVTVSADAAGVNNDFEVTNPVDATSAIAVASVTLGVDPVVAAPAEGTVTITETAATDATGTITLTNQVDPGDQVTINDGNGAETFTFVVGVPANDNEVQIGADVNASAAALAAAIAAHANLAVDAGAANNIVLVNANVTGNVANWAVTETTDPNDNLTVTDANGEDAFNAEVGDQITVTDGLVTETFTFVAGAPANDNEVQIGANPTATATNLANAINNIGSLDVTAAAALGVVTVTANTNENNPDFDITEPVNATNLAAAVTSAGVDEAFENAVAGETVTVHDGTNTQTFTFVVGAPANANQVQIGADAAETATNLRTAIEASNLDVNTALQGVTLAITAASEGNRPLFAVTSTSDAVVALDDQGVSEVVENAEAGDAVQVDDGTNAPVTFTFVAGAPANAHEVQIGANAAATAANLLTAIQAAITANELAVVATANANPGVHLVSTTLGANPDFAVTEVSDVNNNLTVADTQGAAATVANAEVGESVTINTGTTQQTFTFVAGAPANDNQVQIGADAAATLANLAQQINDLNFGVTAAVVGGTLTVTSTTAGVNEDFAITQGVQPIDATITVDEGSDAVATSISAATLDVNTGKGNDVVTLGSVGGPANQIQISGKTKFTTGDGDDIVTLRNANLVGAVNANTGNDNDTVNLIDSFFSGKWKLTGGNGDDDITVDGSNFEVEPNFNLGKGIDTATLLASIFEDGLTVKSALVEFA